MSSQAFAIATRVIVCLVVAALWTIGGVSCASDPTQGYSTQSLFQRDVATIAVPIFENDTFHRDVEFQLTDALIKEIERRTPYKVAPTIRADTILIGHIRRVELDPISKSRLTGLTEELIVRVSVDFRWTDLRTDTRLVERRSFEGTSLFVPSNPSGESLEIGQFAVVQQLARDIVDEMQAQW